MKRKYILPSFLLFQIILLKIIPYFPEMVEQYYSNGLYAILSKFERIILGKIPFSIGDILYFMLILLGLNWLFNKRKTWKLEWKNNTLSILSFISVFYFFFHLLWGLNYYRQPLFEKMAIERDYSNADLLAFTKKIIAKTNTIQKQLTNNDRAKVVVPYSQEEFFEMNIEGYKSLSKKFPFLSTKIQVSRNHFSVYR